MISRKTAKLIGEMYHEEFHRVSTHTNPYSRRDSYTYILNIDQLYDFLYEEDYDVYFLNLVKQIHSHHSTNPRDLKEFFMKLHTGETLYPGTKDWKWEERQKLGQRFLKDLAQDLIKMLDKHPSPNYSRKWEVDKYNEKRESSRKLKAQLELDGYIYKDEILYQVDSSVINEQEEQTYLENLIDRLSLSDKEVIKHHIKNAEEHYINGKWDDSISNSRKFLEAVLAQVADAFSVKKYGSSLNASKLARPVEIREYLEREKLIETKEKEAISKVYGLLSGTGSHPYIAEKDQARLMWHLALTFSQFVLLRYEGHLKSNP